MSPPSFLNLPPRNIVCFHVLVIVSNAAMNIGVCIFFVLVFFSPLDKCPEMELLNCMVVLYLSWRTSIPLSVVAVPIYIPTSSAQGSLFSTSSLTFLFLVFSITTILTGVRQYLIVVLICIWLMISDGEPLLVY